MDSDIVIVGSGVAGSTLARELAKNGRKVLVVEKGPDLARKKFGSQFYAAVNLYDRLGLLSRSRQGVFFYRSIAVGGTSLVSCGNGVRGLEAEFKNLGMDLTQEFLEAEKELAVTPVPDRFIGRGTKRIMDAADKLGFKMMPMPKIIDFRKCVSCGNCVLGCRTTARWSALTYLKEARDNGASLLAGADITKVLVSEGRAAGVEGRGRAGRKIEIRANTVILAAGGIGTPVILQNSGIEAGRKLFLDLFNVTIGLTKDTGMDKEVTMAAVNIQDGFLLSPFIDCALAYVSVSPFRHILKFRHRDRMLGIMTKIDDDPQGGVRKDGVVEKTLTPADLSKLNKGAEISGRILLEAGCLPRTIAVTKVRGAHPGGTAAIDEVVDRELETRIKRLFVCDASVLPKSPGVPPILTIIALAKRFAKRLK
ncbi:MAG: GMC family oxidoreductase [Candidatus Omnitrophica bacterium]|nr:GMC family oxidoreductase [Candidatus Omnitrophota bacterium]